MVFKQTPQFRKSFAKLSAREKKSAKAAFKIFRANPFDLALRPHKINRLTARYHTVVRAVVIEADLRAVFIVEGDAVISLDIGTHDIYN